MKESIDVVSCAQHFVVRHRSCATYVIDYMDLLQHADACSALYQTGGCMQCTVCICYYNHWNDSHYGHMHTIPVLKIVWMYAVSA